MRPVVAGDRTGSRTVGDEVEMKPSDSLPFDDSAATRGVVAYAQLPKLDIYAAFDEQSRHPASTFAQVDDYSHKARRVSRLRSTNCPRLWRFAHC